MIITPGYPGVVFTTAVEGDMRGSPTDRKAVADRLEVSPSWAVVDQVHGAHTVRATDALNYGSGDALFTTELGLPLAVFTADCLGVALTAEGAVGVAHAGWRGIVAGVVPALIGQMVDVGCPPVRAAVGPGIGPCCYEVGADVSDRLPGFISETTWGTTSVNLRGAVLAQLDGLDVWDAGACTRCGAGFHSHRTDATSARMATISWRV